MAKTAQPAPELVVAETPLEIEWFNFPELGISIQASSLAEAIKLLGERSNG